VREQLAELEQGGAIAIERKKTARNLNAPNTYLLNSSWQPETTTPGSSTTLERSTTPGRREYSGRAAGSTTPGRHQNELIERTHEQDTPSTSSKLRFTDGDREVAGWMFGLIKALCPGHRQANLDKWANVIHLMRERDGRTHEEIRSLFGFANSDGFWSANILSPDALREKWDRLTIKKHGSSNNGKQRQAAGPGQKYDPNGAFGHF
jgi:hypothetical protein